MKTVFFRVLNAEDKGKALLEAVHNLEPLNGQRRFDVDPRSFVNIPGAPFAYWVSKRLSDLFSRAETIALSTKCGMGTLDDDRHLRLTWEVAVASRGIRWRNFAKGGEFSPYYLDLAILADWYEGGRELKAAVETKVGSASRKIQAVSFYFRPGLTWSRRSQKGLSVRALPEGCIFGDVGPAAFVEGDGTELLLSGLSLTNSSAFRLLVSLQIAFGKYEVGPIQRTPFPSLSSTSRRELADLGREAWSKRRSLDTITETSHAFTLPALLQVSGANVADRAASWSVHVRTVQAELTTIQADIDQRCFALYGIDDADRRVITEGFGTRGSEEESSDGVNEAEDDAGEDTDENESTADATGLAAELVSWSVGVAFGRFDIRLATGERPTPAEPEPFDPLPVCSPGILASADGLPLARPPAGYPLTFPENGVLVDDPGHAQHLLTAMRVVFDLVFGVEVDRWWNDVAALLDPKGHDLRVWLASSFFEHHLKRHSKSRRKAPIFWQLGTPSGGYSVWLYAHRLTRDSFFQLQNEVVGPKLAHEERQLTSLIQNAGGNPSASERKAIAAQEAFVEELRTTLDEVMRVAPLWNPNLDDGVVLTMAPLWRLVPQHKSWQKELKSKWDDLAAGKYDWAHLAMHLWPERVVPKCASDRSLAIAHGLEDVLWIESADGKWKTRTTPLRPIEELVNERTSSAVKAALKSLLQAPTTSGNGRARGRQRVASVATTVGGNP